MGRDEERGRELRAAKSALRQRMRLLRRERGPRERVAAGQAAAARIAALLAEAPPGPVALFQAKPEEIDTRPAIEAVLAAGRSVLLPRQEGGGLPLAFHSFRPGDPLVPGPAGILEPVPFAPRLPPVLLFVPLLAFDRGGRRLGQGGGFYDRTLAALRAGEPRPLAWGFAFAFQEVEAVPAGPGDEPLAGVITEAETIRAGAAR